MPNWGAGAKGAAGGAAMGAALGPYGAAAGAAIGGAIGLFSGGGAPKKPEVDTRFINYDPVTDRLGKIADGAQMRAAPQATAVRTGAPAQLATGQIDQSRGGMLGVANQLGGIASGTQMGAGEMAVNRQLGQATAAQTSAARMARGANSALAYRNAARNTADIGLAGAGMAAEAQRADQQGALNQLGSVYGNMYGQDANVAAQNAQFQQQAMLADAQAGNAVALANLQAQIAQTGMNDAQQMAALGQILGWDQATVNARLAQAGLAPTPVAPDVGAGLMAAGGQALATYASMPRGVPEQQPSSAAPTQAPPPSLGPVTSTTYDDPLGPYRRPVY